MAVCDDMAALVLVVVALYFIAKYMSNTIWYFVGDALPFERKFVDSDGVSPRIPDPPEASRPHMATVRLSDAEKAQLEQARQLLGKRWNRPTVGNADVIRVAIGMLLEELQRDAAADSAEQSARP